MDERIVIALCQSLRLGRNISLMEVAQEHAGQADHIAYPRAMIIPRRTAGLVGLVEIAHPQHVLQPQDRRRIARNIAALAAGFMVPKLIGGDLLVPAIERLDRLRFVLLSDAVDDDLAVLLQLPHDVAHILDAAFVDHHGAAVDPGFDPGCGGARLIFAEAGIAPLRAVPGEAIFIAAFIVHPVSPWSAA